MGGSWRGYSSHCIVPRGVWGEGEVFHLKAFNPCVQHLVLLNELELHVLVFGLAVNELEEDTSHGRVQMQGFGACFS